MLSGDEPMQAVARTMTSANHAKLVKYDGDAVLWQGVNRIQADHVEIDRDKRSIVADGHVITQSREEKKADDDAAPAAAHPAVAAAKPADQADAGPVGSSRWCAHRIWSIRIKTGWRILRAESCSTAALCK